MPICYKITFINTEFENLSLKVEFFLPSNGHQNCLDKSLVSHIYQSVMKQHQISTRKSSDMIKLQHCCTGNRNIIHTLLKKKKMTLLENYKVKILSNFSMQTETTIDIISQV